MPRPKRHPPGRTVVPIEIDADLLQAVRAHLRDPVRARTAYGALRAFAERAFRRELEAQGAPTAPKRSNSDA